MKRILLMWVGTVAVCVVSSTCLPHPWRFFWLLPARFSLRAVWDGVVTVLTFQPILGLQLALLLAATLVTAGWLLWRLFVGTQG
jgi:hypothetical protein